MNRQCVLVFGVACIVNQLGSPPLGEVFGNEISTEKKDNCIYGPWTEWSSCSTTCGTNGERIRYRTVSMKNSTNADNGFICEQPVREGKACVSGPCPNDCILSDWSEWGACNCQINQTERTRSVVRAPKEGGRICPSELRQVKACDANESCVQDCQLGDWSEWSVCTVTCGQGAALRQRSIIRTPINGGAPCPMLGELVKCNLGGCPEDESDSTCRNISGNVLDPSRLCSRYYISCLHGKSTWRMCPKGLRYQESSDTCDYPRNMPECVEELEGGRNVACSYSGHHHKALFVFAVSAVMFLTWFL